MEQTKHYGLKKPAPEDFYDVADQNANMDAIDAALKVQEDHLANKAGLDENGKVPVEQLTKITLGSTNYPIPEYPVYDPNIRKIQNGDYVDAEQVLGPVLQRMIENQAADHQGKAGKDELEAALAGMDYEPSGSAAAVQQQLDIHLDDTANPHGVTAKQIGLGKTLTLTGAVSETYDGTADTTVHIPVRNTMPVVRVGTRLWGWTEDECDYLCPGNSQDADIIQQAVTDLEAKGGGILYFLNGKYYITYSISITKGEKVWIVGQSNRVVLKKIFSTNSVTEPGMFNFISDGDSSYIADNREIAIVIKNISVDLTDSTLQNNDVAFTFNLSKSVSVKFIGVTANGRGTANGCKFSYGSTWAYFVDCFFRNLYTVAQNTKLSMIRCEVVNCSSVGERDIPPYNLELIDNIFSSIKTKFYYYGYGAYNEPSPKPMTKTTIRGNRFYDCIPLNICVGVDSIVSDNYFFSSEPVEFLLKIEGRSSQAVIKGNVLNGGGLLVHANSKVEILNAPTEPNRQCTPDHTYGVIVANNSITNYLVYGIKLMGNMINKNGAGWTQPAVYSYLYNSLVTGNSIWLETGATSNYTSSQYTILVDVYAQKNLICDNVIPGKNYINNGGSTNTFYNNKYN